MLFRLFSLAMAAFFAWASAMQLNDPDPARWFLIYAGAAGVATRSVLAKPIPVIARSLGVVALVWAAAIAPELWGGWGPRDLTATMSTAHPEVEYGREFVGLLILALYCFAAARLTRRTRST